MLLNWGKSIMLISIVFPCYNCARCVHLEFSKSTRDRSRTCKTGTEPVGNGTEPCSGIRSAESGSRTGTTSRPQPHISSHHHRYLLTRGRYGGKYDHFWPLYPILFRFREFTVPSRSVNSAQTIRPDPYRGLKSGP